MLNTEYGTIRFKYYIGELKKGAPKVFKKH